MQATKDLPLKYGIPLLPASEGIQTDRILNLIDVLADSEGRMKWASNKRLHFEIGIIKAIQSLNDARISDVIKALAGAGSLSDLQTAKRNTTSTPTPPASVPLLSSCPLQLLPHESKPMQQPQRPNLLKPQKLSTRRQQEQTSLSQSQQKEASMPSSTQLLKQLPSQLLS